MPELVTPAAERIAAAMELTFSTVAVPAIIVLTRGFLSVPQEAGS
jgi:hypothetical protein